MLEDIDWPPWQSFSVVGCVSDHSESPNCGRRDRRRRGRGGGGGGGGLRSSLCKISLLNSSDSSSDHCRDSRCGNSKSEGSGSMEAHAVKPAVIVGWHRGDANLTKSWH